jgi:cell division protease FtsH
MSYIWDPELWVKFKEAVQWNQPHIFWNKLAERIEYSESMGAVQWAGIQCTRLC